jgi:uncharacterized membrane protein
MEILRWEILAPVIAVVGICEVIKSMFDRYEVKFPTFLVSLVLSIIAGFLSAHIPGPYVLENAVYSAFLIYGSSTLAYELVLRRFERIAHYARPEPDTGNKQKKSKESDNG